MVLAPSPAVAGDWARTRRRLRLRWLPVLIAVAGLHLLLLMLLQGQLRHTDGRAAPAQAPLVLVRIQPPAPQPPEAAPPAREPAVAQPPRRPTPTRSSAEPASSQAVVAAEPASAASAALPSAQAAASAAAGGLLETEASRRAIREAARQRSTSEMGAATTDEQAPLSELDKTGQAIARGARGDCLKGEFAGSGMGLFSLPFWLLAEMREKCRR